MTERRYGEVTSEAISQLSRSADPFRAESERAYLKSTRDFLGVNVPACRTVARALTSQGWASDRDALCRCVEELWDGPYFECRRVAVMLLVLNAQQLDPANSVDRTLVARLIRSGETWAIVDDLAVHVAGSMFDRSPLDMASELDAWSNDDSSFWLRRASMLALLGGLRRGGGDWDRFVRYSVPMLSEKEFFIRKSIGWILREVSKKRPELVVDYLAEFGDRCSGLTLREASKYLVT